MKFQDFASFQRSVEKALPLAALVIAPEDFERSKIFEQIFALFQKKGKFQMLKFSYEETPPAIESLLSGSLFAENPFVIIDPLDASKKKLEECIANYLKNPNPRACLLLGSREKKGLSLYGEIMERGVVFDLGFEKIKDREKRLLERVAAKCSIAKKRMEPGAVELFFAKTGLDGAIVESESEKLFCFVGEKELIEKSDVEAVCSSSDTRSLWEMAEDFVWKQKLLPCFENSLFHPLLSAIRYQLELGLCMASGEERREESSFYYKKEEEKRKIALQKGVGFFKKSLRLLFEIDLWSKTQVGSVDSLFAYLYLKMFEDLV